MYEQSIYIYSWIYITYIIPSPAISSIPQKKGTPSWIDPILNQGVCLGSMENTRGMGF